MKIDIPYISWNPYFLSLTIFHCTKGKLHPTTPDLVHLEKLCLQISFSKQMRYRGRNNVFCKILVNIIWKIKILHDVQIVFKFVIFSSLIHLIYYKQSFGNPSTIILWGM